MKIRRSVSSRRPATNQRATADAAASIGRMVEPLEMRTLMAGDPLAPMSAYGVQVGTPITVDWHGGEVSAKAGSWMLTFESRQTDAQARAGALAAAAKLGVSVTNVQSIGRGKYAMIETTGLITEAAIRAALPVLGGLKAIEPNAVYSVNRLPNDPDFSSAWWHDNTGQFIGGPGVVDADIDTTNAWDLTIGNEDVIVAVIDTGVQVTHPDLQANIWVNPGEIVGNGIDDDGNGFVDDINGWDFGELDNNPDDVDGHGTQCAGMIAGVGNNGIGSAGVAWNASIMALKIADKFGNLSLAAIVGAHDYGTMMRERGTNVVASNNSYAGYAPSFYADAPEGFLAERDAIVDFIESGATFVASAGNASYDNDDPDLTAFPTSYNIPGLIAVAATDNQDNLAGFSSYGAQSVDLGAPGVNTYTTAINSSYSFFGGTSAAGPAVAGAVALLKSYKPNASAEEIRTVLINSADPLPSLQGKTVSGGRLNVRKALDQINLTGPVVRAVNPGPVTGQIDANTGQAVRSVTVRFSEPILASALSTGGVSLRRDGNDNLFFTADDQLIPITAIAVSPDDATRVVITLGLNSFPQQRLPIDKYQLQLDDAFFKDIDGNFLNGSSTSGRDEVYSFTVVGISTDNEPNDTLATATLVNFNASGSANFAGATIGNGTFSSLDVDVYRIEMGRGGLIQAEITAKRLPTPSSLDSYIRLFNGSGVEIANNDQFFGADSYLDFFVSTGGTYYVAVSGFGNESFSPTSGGSGTSQSTGQYNIRLDAELAADETFSVGGTLPAPLPIPTDTGETLGKTSSTIIVSDTRQILDVDVRLTLAHEFDSDLVITLISPSGREVTLTNRRGGSGQNFTATLFDDEATAAIASGTAPFAGGFRPDVALSGFDGEKANGTWTLLVDDTTPIHVGQLISWSMTFLLRNNIFGPFESNETLITSNVLNTVSQSGTPTPGTFNRNASIGDGGFGGLDRDLYEIVVGGGYTLDVTVKSDTVLNTAIRLFDSTGMQVTLASPSNSKDSNIQRFVFADGGTFYIGISDSTNINYDPFAAASGTLSATTGGYEMAAVLTLGVSDLAHTLEGNILDVGVTAGGLIYDGASATQTGIRWNGIEFLFDTDAQTRQPATYFSASAGGIGFLNQFDESSISSIQVPLATQDQSDFFNRRTRSQGVFQNLRIDRSISLGVNDSFFVIDVTLTNTSGTAIGDVVWSEGFNPSPGLNLFPNGRSTANDIDNSSPMATARFRNNTYEQGLTIGLAAPDSDARARAYVLDRDVVLRDAAELLALPSTDPNGASSDSLLALTFDIGTLSGAGLAGSSATMRYFVFVGENPTDVSTLYDTVNNGTGSGHLVANSSQPVDESLLQPDGVTVTNIASLPYRLYYPEGFANFQTYTFIPMMNPSDQATRVVVVARYELDPNAPTARRDHVISDFTLQAGARGGITITSPEMYAADTLLVEKDRPYSLEIRTESPIAATFSHYDQFLLAGGRSAIGEAFTTQVSTDWTFGEVTKGGSNSDFVLFTNTTGETIKITTVLYPQDTDGDGLVNGTPITLTAEIGPYRRGGWNFNTIPFVDGSADDVRHYGVRVSSTAPIVAALSHYDSDTRAASGYSGTPSSASLRGILPEGQLGQGANSEILQFLNATSTDAAITLSFLLATGSTYRTQLIVPKNSQGTLDVATLPQFPIGTSYSVLFESTVPVSVSQQSSAFGEGLATGFTDKGFSLWGFGEGFRPAGNGESVVENLRLVNPGSADSLVEITMRFDNNLGSETFRYNVPARQAVEINVHDLVTGPRRDQFAFYGITVKSAEPIIASMTHYDSFFPGAFATLGTPLGIATPIT